ncbi:MAG: hypothetical protein HC822_22405 [Oscillochloris sp.]|nr:hypothetical protein [Oscillochloris sp.]
MLRTGRFYSIPYLSLATLCSLIIADPYPSALLVAVALLVPLCFAVGIAALNDLLHISRDLRAGRGRTTDRNWLLGLTIGGSVSALGCAGLGGLSMIFGLLGSLIAGVLYALWKSIPLVSNLVRGLTTTVLLLGAAGMGGGFVSALLFAVGVGILDSAGNLWGDVRDQEVDQRAGTITIATLYPSLAPWLAIGLHAVATTLLATITPFVWLGLPLGILLLKAPSLRVHEHFLQLKYLTFAVIGISLAPAFPLALVIICLSLLVVPASMLYRRIHTPATPLTP